ncbi:MAG: hypothetical protein ACPGT1_08935, partial [Ilumatobacteraceae bacterium]
QVADGAAPATIEAVAAVPAVTVSTGTGVTVSPGTITATAAVPAVTVTVADTVAPATITATAAVPAVTVTTGTGVTVSPATITAVAAVPAPTITITSGDTTVAVDTIAGSSSVPSPTFTLGQGVTVAPGTVVATVTVDATVSEGAGRTVVPVQVRAVATVPDLGLASRVVLPADNILPQVDVVPYHVHDAARSLARFRTPGAKGRNVFILTNGTVTTRQPGDPSSVSRTLLGGHESPTDLTSTELDALIAAGYAVEVR